MLTFKINDPALLQAAKILKAANAMAAQSKKEIETAKAIIAQRLQALRQVNISQLPIGDMISIEGILLIEIGKQNRFDVDKFQVDNGALYAKYKKDFATVKIKSLV